MGEENRVIQDFGEKIGGAKKDRWKLYGMSIDDALALDIENRKLLINKENVWGSPNYQELSKKYPSYLLLFAKKISTGIRAPQNFDDYTIRSYIQTVQDIKDVIFSSKNDDDLLDFRNRLLKGKGYIGNNGQKKRFYFRNTKFIDKFVGVKALENLKLETVAHGFPDNYRVEVKGIQLKTIKEGDREVFYVILEKPNYNINIYNKFESKEDAYDFVKKDLPGIIEKAREGNKVDRKIGVVQIKRPTLRYISRVGGDIRKNRSVGAEDIQKFIGFRGVEFGIQNNDDDRQACLDYTFDAFCDLAFVLNTSLDRLNLDENK